MKKTGFLILALLWAGAAQAQTVSVQLMHNANWGPYLADEKGRAFYVFLRDMKDVATCLNKQCRAFFRPVMGRQVRVDKPLNASDFGSFSYVRGPSQLTFRGAPLYTAVRDNVAGDVKGSGMDGVWSLVNPDAFTGPAQ